MTQTTPMEAKLAHIEKCLDWSTVEKYNNAIVALAYIEEIRKKEKSECQTPTK